MADVRDLKGDDYTKDFAVLREFLSDLSNTLRVDSLEGEVITHTFTTTSAEVITHKLGRTPTSWVILDSSVAATVHRTAWGTSSISLVSSSSSLVLKFYVE